MILKKTILILLAVFVAAGSFSACSFSPKKSDNFSSSKSSDNSTNSGSSASSGKKLSIVTTIFPEYDWTRNILGKNPAGADVTMLLDKGTDLHSYQPSAEDLRKISDCDVFIYVGGESDKWVNDALKEARNTNMKAVNLLDILGDTVKEEETVEGMQEEEAPSEEDSSEGGTSENEPEYDEHVWLSLRNAEILVKHIADTLCEADPENTELYQQNAAAYTYKLKNMDQAYQDTVQAASVKTVLFGDRFPFRYLMDDYGLTYYAAFAGCSAETEASFETIRFLADKVDALSLHSILTIEKNDGKIARTIIQNTEKKDQQILSLDSMQSTTAEDVENGASYLAVMEQNRSVLAKALENQEVTA